MNPVSRYQTIFYATAFIIVSILTAVILWPFFIVLALSAMVAVILEPVYKYISGLVKSKNIGALLTLLLLVVVLAGPISLLLNQIISEAQNLYGRVSTGNADSLDFISTKIEHAIQRYSPDFTIDIKNYISVASSWIISNMGGIFGGTLDFLFKTILFLVALFYFLRDGAEFKDNLMLLSPLPESKDKFLATSLKSAIRSVIIGSIAVSIIQGTIAGIGFWIFGVPNFTLWGMSAAIASFVPGIGTALIWAPACIYLFFYGNGIAWVGLLIWSIFCVALVDNFLAPMIINKGVNVHPLLILFSILGGIHFFGPSGFLIGPLIVSLLFVLIRIAEIGGDVGKKSTQS